VPPDASIGEFGFDFKRFGVRVPTVLVSPLIPLGSVYRASGSTPLDHTSILKTVEQRWGIPSLTARDAAAPDVGGALTLGAARTDDPLAGVAVPTATTPHHPGHGRPSHLQAVYAELAARLPLPDEPDASYHSMPELQTADECATYIEQRVERWKATRARVPA
jgi:phospholipase C